MALGNHQLFKAPRNASQKRDMLYATFSKLLLVVGYLWVCFTFACPPLHWLFCALIGAECWHGPGLPLGALSSWHPLLGLLLSRSCGITLSLLFTWPLAPWLPWQQSSLEEPPLSNFLRHPPAPSGPQPPGLIKQAGKQVLVDLVKWQQDSWSVRSRRGGM